MERCDTSSEQKPKRSKQELIKESSQFLRGTILDELSCDTDKFSAADVSVCVATEEDRQREADLGDLHQRVLKASDELISQRGLSVTAVDAEHLFDGQTIIVYYLGEPTEKLGPVAVELSKTADNRRVQFQLVGAVKLQQRHIVGGEFVRIARQFVHDRAAQELARFLDQLLLRSFRLLC